MACILNLSTCSLDNPEDAHQGGIKTSQTAPCRNLRGKQGGGRIFEGGIFGDYGIGSDFYIIECMHGGNDGLDLLYSFKHCRIDRYHSKRDPCLRYNPA